MNHFASRSRRRSRSTAQERADWVRRYEQSGLTQREFSHRHRLGLSTLQRWIARTRVESGRSVGPMWQELKMPTAVGGPRWVVELVRPDGLTVRLTPEAPVELVSELLRVRAC